VIGAGKTDWRTDIQSKQQSVIDGMRVAYYIHPIPEAVDMITDAHQKGYETTPTDSQHPAPRLQQRPQRRTQCHACQRRSQLRGRRR
jgi:hypothetical protein